MVNTFEKWVSTVKAEFEKLDAIRFYLNEKGEERRRAFDQLYDMANFCSDATELVEWIDNPEGIGRLERAFLQSGHAMSPISRLRKIALTEVANATGKQKILNQLDELKKNHPDQVILVETPNGTVSLKIGEAQIFEGMRGEIVIDNE